MCVYVIFTSITSIIKKSVANYLKLLFFRNVFCLVLADTYLKTYPKIWDHLIIRMLRYPAATE